MMFLFRQFFVRWATIGGLLLATSLADAQVVAPFLPQGSQYRYVFVTSGQLSITSGDIADYNAFVTSAANSNPDLVALNTTWTVMGSSWSVSARDNTGTNPFNAGHTSVPIYRLDGTQIASSNSDLWDGAIAAPINRDESGAAHSGISLVGTGSDTDGTSGYAPFGSVIYYAGQYRPIVTNGLTTNRNGQWISDTAYLYPFMHLYAISAPITVGGDPGTGVPEPSTVGISAVLLIGASGAIAWRRRFAAG